MLSEYKGEFRFRSKCYLSNRKRFPCLQSLGKKFSIAFIKYLPLKTTTREKIEIHFSDQNVSPYNINMTMAFLNWPIKTLINQNLS